MDESRAFLLAWKIRPLDGVDHGLPVLFVGGENGANGLGCKSKDPGMTRGDWELHECLFSERQGCIARYSMGEQLDFKI